MFTGVNDYGSSSGIHFDEVMGEGSRGFTVSRKSVSKKFVFTVTSELFLDNAASYPLPGTDLDMLFDDAVVQKEVIPIFWSQAPLTYLFWLSDTSAVMLYAADMDVEQISFSTWKITITYDIPDDNGSSALGGGFGDQGPSNGEQNSNNFTQLSFNGSTGTTQIQVALLKEIQQSNSFPAEPMPYVVNRMQPIGVSEDEVTGAEVYTRQFRFQITQYMPPSKLTYSYIRRLSRMITCVNKFPFFGFAPGSVMFIGYSGQGDLYEAVPVTLEFEVKTNFKFVTAAFNTPANPNDVFIPGPGGTIRVDVSNQFDQIGDLDFPPTAVNAISGMAAGVHSGWSIVSYMYLKQLSTTSAAGIIRMPSHRLIYDYYQPQDFSFFLL
jgi:hypothetical protein